MVIAIELKLRCVVCGKATELLPHFEFFKSSDVLVVRLPEGWLSCSRTQEIFCSRDCVIRDAKAHSAFDT
jgi:hypothetical protein